MIPLLTAAAAMWLAWLIGKEVRERYDNRMTVEAERDYAREIQAYVPQHNGSAALTVGDYPDDQHEAPCWALIDRVHDANVSGL